MGEGAYTSPIKLFYSYSHTDEALRVQLEKHLSLLKRQGLISGWHDREIAAGAEWAGEINRNLEEADIILLLVSADFIDSKYCYDVELKRAMERHASGSACIIPIILRPCDWQTAPFGKLQALPTDAKALTLWQNHDAAFADIVRGIRQVCEKITRAAQRNDSEPKERVAAAPTLASQSSELGYSNLFQISSLILPYIVLVGAWEENSNEYGMGEVECVTDRISTYELPEDFRNNPPPASHFSDAKCRLKHYDCEILQAGLSRLSFTFSKINYLDYLISGEYLDYPLPGDPTRTFRDKYAPRLDFNDLSQSRLTNISGVGIFIITRDDKIIISKHSHSVRVYHNTWTFSASGTMDWVDNGDINPFIEARRECIEEIDHTINLDNTYLFGFGVDAKKLYYQFSFFERTSLSSEGILRKARMARDYHAEMQDLTAVPFELDAIVSVVKQHDWEPAAAAGLLTLCAKRFGHSRVERAIDPEFVRKRFRDEMAAEWEYRASRPKDQAVMSARYPVSRIVDESKKYVEAVLDFIGSDVERKEVLEIGAGIGRMSEILVHKAKQLTCLDLSSAMLERNRARLGIHAQKVQYVQMFAQDFRPEKSYDVVISSLMLIHNVDDGDFRRLVEVMKMSSRTIFLFEHVDVGQQVSQHTRVRSEEELLSAFPEYKVERRREYQIFTDNILFLKLTR
jgi:SAM-dependent methyltransferase